ncbi:MAG TPA: hypothetical protein GX513_02530 [Firmicutes bacterium]|nr:hypothetical protein [Bacillota bacterium]
MRVKLRYLAQLQVQTGRSEEWFELRDAATAVDLATAVAARYGRRMREMLFDGSGRLALVVSLDGRRIDPSRSLYDGGEVVFLMPMGGG